LVTPTGHTYRSSAPPLLPSPLLPPRPDTEAGRTAARLARPAATDGDAEAEGDRDLSPLEARLTALLAG
ncbi:MAG: hypothetical protein L0H25_09630, partial [Micrococcales bacterium]|nr:hypothetical protein [Micrococcales bacterium]